MTIAGMQLYLGEKEHEMCTPQALSTLLNTLFSHTEVPRLMLWNCLGHHYLEAVSTSCRSHGVKLYLWYPVLADKLETAYGAKAVPVMMVQSAWDHSGYGVAGLWQGIDAGEETFRFHCPNAVADWELFAGEFLALISTGLYDGVFLDRIRYPSPSNGMEMLFSCFCPACQLRYQELGIDSVELKHKATHALSHMAREWEAIEHPAFDNSAPFSSWIGFLADSGLAQMQTMKTRSIAKVAAWFAAEARRRNLQVGADLFSPSLAPLVGQDYLAFREFCDWIKPMAYFHARGPAGIQLEMGCLRKGVSALTDLDPEQTCKFLSLITGLPVAERGIGCADTLVDPRYLRFEVSKAFSLGSSADCAVFPGLEMVHHPRFAPPVTETMLRTSLSYLPQDTRGMIPSWNLLYIPDEYLRIVAETNPGGQVC